MERINFEAYVDYLQSFCGVENARDLACKIFSENYPTQRITSKREIIEIEDCDYDPATECWIPTGRIKKYSLHFFKKN
jgi:hypothetical protein